MNNDSVTVNRMHWLKLFPGLHLWLAVRMAFRIRILVPAALAMLGSVYGPEVSPDNFERSSENPSRLVRKLTAQHPSSNLLFDVTSELGPESLNAVVPRQISAIVSNAAFLMYSGSWNAFLILTWNMLLVGVFGAAVARSTATEFCRGSRTGPLAAMRFSLKRVGSLLLSAGLAIGVVTAVIIPLLLAGFVSKEPAFLGSVVMFCWPLLFVISLVAIFATGVFSIGWGLSIAAIGTDDCNGPDALSRGVNYFLSHKLLTIWYLCLTILASLAARLIGWLMLGGATSLLASRIVNVFDRLGRPMEDSLTTAERVLQKTHTALQFLPETLQLAAFLSGLCLMYVLLREKEDAVQLGEIDGAAIKVAAP